MTKQETLNSFLVALSSTCPTMNRRLCIRAAQSFWNGFSFNVQLDGLFIDVSESNVAMVNWSAWGAVSAERAGVFAAAVAQGVECAKRADGASVSLLKTFAFGGMGFPL